MATTKLGSLGLTADIIHSEAGVLVATDLTASNPATNGFQLSATTGGVLSWASAGAGSDTVAGLTDTAISGITTHQILVWDGTDWVNRTVGSDMTLVSGNFALANDAVGAAKLRNVATQRGNDVLPFLPFYISASTFGLESANTKSLEMTLSDLEGNAIAADGGALVKLLLSDNAQGGIPSGSATWAQGATDADAILDGVGTATCWVQQHSDGKFHTQINEATASVTRYVNVISSAGQQPIGIAGPASTIFA